MLRNKSGFVCPTLGKYIPHNHGPGQVVEQSGIIPLSLRGFIDFPPISIPPLSVLLINNQN